MKNAVMRANLDVLVLPWGTGCAQVPRPLTDLEAQSSACAKEGWELRICGMDRSRAAAGCRALAVMIKSP